MRCTAAPAHRQAGVNWMGTDPEVKNSLFGAGHSQGTPATGGVKQAVGQGGDFYPFKILKG